MHNLIINDFILFSLLTSIDRRCYIIGVWSSLSKKNSWEKKILKMKI